MQFQWPYFGNYDNLNKKRNQETDKRFFKKSYKLPSGKIVFVQGAEDSVLTDLLENYRESDIVIEDDKIERCIGKIFYKSLNGKIKRYYPDFYIRSENMIIEVKSSYTYKIHEKINKLKQQACLSSGYRFKFVIK